MQSNETRERYDPTKDPLRTRTAAWILKEFLHVNEHGVVFGMDEGKLKDIFLIQDLRLVYDMSVEDKPGLADLMGRAIAELERLSKPEPVLVRRPLGQQLSDNIVFGKESQ